MTMTLADALILYCQGNSVTLNSQLIRNLRTTLKKYVLPGFEVSAYALRNLDKCFTKVSLQVFIAEAKRCFEQAYQQALEQGKSEATLKNNRSNLYQFLKWLELQAWYQEVVQPTDIPERAPKMKADISIAKLHKGRKHAGAIPYALKDNELTTSLNQQIESFRSYGQSEWLRTKKGDTPINDTTWGGYYKILLHFLGWLKNEIGFDVNDLDITLLADMDTLNEYLSWHFTVKKNGYRNALNIGIAALNIAKWKYGPKSQRDDYSDCEQVLDIRDLNRRLSANIPKDRRTTSQSALKEKLLEMEQCMEIVEYLRRCCAPKFSCGKERKIHAIIDSWQDFLIAAILTYTPVRQKEIRELRIGKNLKREADGWWVYLTPDEHKTGAKTGKSREYPLFPCHLKERLTKDLDQYVNKLRPLANLNHDYLFFRPGNNAYQGSRGETIKDANCLSGTVPKLFLRISALIYGVENAKCPSPHDFRRICATWVCKYGTPEEVAIYAELMGHSPTTFYAIYQQCTSRDKTERTETAFLTIQQRAARIQVEKSGKKALGSSSLFRLDPAILAVLTPEQKEELRLQGFEV